MSSLLVSHGLFACDPERRVGDFKQLEVWRNARALVRSTYKMTTSLPPSEQFCLSAQMRRAAVSIAANIAESRGRYTNHDQARLEQIALGSARELECLVILACDLEFTAASVADPLRSEIDRVQRMLASMIAKKRSDRA